MQFMKATKEKAKLRAAMFGPSGAGKTFSALRIATGIGGKLAVIDTERGSASKYADRFQFDVLDLPKKNIATYTKAIKAAGDSGYEVLIIDSLSHAWQELLQEVDQLAKAKFRGNTWSAWSEGTPKQRMLVDAILDFPGHVIATMRSKTEWAQEQSNNGKTKPVRVGLAPEQGKGIEYEFDLLLELSVDHIVNIIKDRTGKFQDRVIEKPGEDFGAALAEWLGSGSEPQPKPEPQPDQTSEKKVFRAYEAKEQCIKAMTERHITADDANVLYSAWRDKIEAETGNPPTRDNYAALYRDITKGTYDEHAQQPEAA